MLHSCHKKTMLFRNRGIINIKMKQTHFWLIQITVAIIIKRVRPSVQAAKTKTATKRVMNSKRLLAKPVWCIACFGTICAI